MDGGPKQWFPQGFACHHANSRYVPVSPQSKRRELAVSGRMLAHSSSRFPSIEWLTASRNQGVVMTTNEPIADASEPMPSPDAAEVRRDPFNVSVDGPEKVFYALAHNRVPVINSLTIRNDHGAFDGVLQIEFIGKWARSDTPPVKPWRTSVTCPSIGDSFTIEKLDLRLDDGQLALLEEACPAELIITLTLESGVTQTYEHSFDILARDEWAHLPEFPSLISAFVQPNHPGVAEVLKSASAILKRDTGSGALQGYQDEGPSGNPDRAIAIGKAVYEALQQQVDNYINPPGSFEGTGQKVRPIDRVLEERQGTCIDLACAYASCLEQAGLNPIIWLVKGHAFAGFLIRSQPLPSASVTDVTTILNIVEGGRIIPIETILLTEKASFEEATRAPLNQFTERKLDAMIDVHLAHREAGIKPIPARVIVGDVVTIVIDPGPGAPVIIERRNAVTNKILPNTTPGRVEVWKSSLLDLTMRNPLLNFRPDKNGLELLPPRGLLPNLEDDLHSGAEFGVLAVDGVSELAAAQGFREATAMTDDLLVDVWNATTSIFSTTSTRSFPTRLKNLMARARLLEQETGSNTLFLTIGSLEWEDPRSTVGPVKSPIFLVPIRMTAKRNTRTPLIRIDESGTTTPNFCLVEALKAKYNLDIPFFGEDMTDELGMDIERGLNSVRQAIVDRGLKFRVDETAAIAVLQFTKFRLWKDLDDHWGEFMSSPVFKHFVESPKTPFVDPVNPEGDPHVVVDETTIFTPVPADGAQLRAIARAVDGESFVLEGPPGTGKSQTITNLLANALAKGKTVLFVAEKDAALSVVRERLESVGLAPYCLDLHDKESEARKVRKKILEALDQQPTHDSAAWERIDLEFAGGAAALRTYRDRLHVSNEAGASYWGAYSTLLQLGEGPSARVPRAFLHTSPETAQTVKQTLSTLSIVAQPAQPQKRHPWSLASGIDFTMLDRSALSAAIALLDSAVSGLPSGEQTDSMIGLGASVDELVAIQEILWLQTTATLPPVSAWDALVTPSWLSSAQAAVAAARQVTATHEGLIAQCGVDVFSIDFAPILSALDEAENSFVLGRKGRIKATLAPFAAVAAIASAEPVVGAQLARQVAAAAAALAAQSANIRAIAGLILPEGWRVEQPGALDVALQRVTILHHVATFLGGSGEASVAARTFVASPAILPPGQSQKLAEFDTAMRQITTQLRSDDTGLNLWTDGQSLLAAVRRSLEAWTQDASEDRFRKLQLWVGFRAELQPLVDAGLNELVTDLLTGELASIDAAKAFDRGFMTTTLQDCSEATNLDVFDRHSHDLIIENFSRQLAERQVQARSVVPSMLAAGRSFNPKATIGEVATLRSELTKVRGKSIRKLIGEYPQLIQQLAPCFLMSPDSVARFLIPGRMHFDIVVFDEASQIPVAQAVGAMGRARSVVVVGDSKQMPPTKFGEGSGTSDEDPFAEVDVEPLVPDDADSILEESLESGLNQEWLSWHYRSEDESLIKFSNDRYYEGKLASFPAPAPNTGGRGIDYRRVQGQFDSGGKRNNPIEAAEIVEEIRQRANDPLRAGWSIGVVTLNKEQQAEVEAQLDALQDPMVNVLRDTEDEDRRLFVLNLENVQGRERDVIMLSTAFSKSADGGAMSLNFGPLNKAGGERRLNVAVTRARRQVIIVSSFDPEEIDERRTSALGMKHLKEYLQMARAFATPSRSDVAAINGSTGQIDTHTDQIAKAFEAQGLIVGPGVGLSGFKVDIALTVPEARDRWLVGVLLDGQQWADRPTAIDRDSLPVAVLCNKMGWKRVARVWLPSWRADSLEIVEEIAQLVRAAAAEPVEVEAAPALPTASDNNDDVVIDTAPSAASVASIAAVESVAPTGSIASLPTVDTQTPEPSAPARGYENARPFVAWSDESVIGSKSQLDDLKTNEPQIRAAILEVIAVEGPIEIERLVKIVARRFDLRKVNARRLEDLGELVPADLISSSDLGEFAWPAGTDRSTWREFRTSESLVRPIVAIAPEELTNAAEAVVRAAHSIDRIDLIREVGTQFGAKAVTAPVRERISEALDWAVSAGRLAVDDDRFTNA